MYSEEGLQIVMSQVVKSMVKTILSSHYCEWAFHKEANQRGCNGPESLLVAMDAWMVKFLIRLEDCHIRKKMGKST